MRPAVGSPGSPRRALLTADPHLVRPSPLLCSTRAAEVALLAAPAPPAEDLEEFYSRLVSIKEFHHAHPNVDSRAADNEIKALVEGSPMDVDGDEPVDSAFCPVYAPGW